jgi:RNA polymerase sigma factor (sigma-70 family)
MEPREDVWSRLLDLRPALIRLALSRTGDPSDAEDCVQEAMLRAAQYADLDLDRVEPFLVVLVSRIATDVHRRRARDSRLGERLASRVAPQSTFEDDVCDRAEAAWVHESLRYLGKRERAVVEALAEGKTLSETVQSLGVTYKAAETALFRIRGKARALVQAGAAALLPLAWRLSRRTTGRTGASASAVAAAAVSVAVVTGGGAIVWHAEHGAHHHAQAAARQSAHLLVAQHARSTTSHEAHDVTSTRPAVAGSRADRPTTVRAVVDRGRHGGRPDKTIVSVPSHRAPGGSRTPSATVKKKERDKSFMQVTKECLAHPSLDPSSLICEGA